MERPRSAEPSFVAGDWTVHPDLNRVTGPDGDVRLEPRVMAVLVHLAAEPGRVVSRTELLDEVWADAVVGEEILTRAVSELRRIFGDSAREPRYIETIINKGYRLIAPVGPVTADEPVVRPASAAAVPMETAAPAEPAAPAAPGIPAAPAGRPLRPVIYGAVVVAAAAALWLAAGRRQDAPQGPAPASLPTVGARAMPLTAYPGHERQPAVTPDGLRVAFAWSGPDGKAEGIWIRQSNSETPLRISSDPGRASWPAWSPDGQSVAWVQQDGGAARIRTASSIGGAARTLHTAPGTIVGLDWGPGDSGLVFAAGDSSAPRLRLQRLDPRSLAVGDADPGDTGLAACVQPRFSPDGRRLAWIRLGPDGTSSLWTAEAGGGGRRRVLETRTGLAGLAWSADGAELVMGMDHAGGYGLWAVPVDGGRAPRRLTDAAEFAWNPAVASGTGGLVYEQVRVDQDLWRIRILGRDPWRLQTDRFLASTRWEYEAEYSPDGRRLALVSARAGTPELWVCDADGANLQRLTQTGDAAVTRPRWSPDGRLLAFNIQEWERSRVAIVPADGGAVRDLTPAGEHERMIGWWTATGDLLLVERGRGSSLGQWLRRVDTGELESSRPPGSFLAWEPSGRFVQPGGGIAHAPDAVCWSPTVLVPDLAPADSDLWRSAGDDILWVLRTGGGAFLMIHETATGKDAFVSDLPGFAGGGLAVAPDASAVVFARLGPVEGDLMQVVQP